MKKIYYKYKPNLEKQGNQAYSFNPSNHYTTLEDTKSVWRHKSNKLNELEQRTKTKENKNQYDTAQNLITKEKRRRFYQKDI